ncbi:MAG TPA: DnaA regulatory inactivator Hda, partial [Alteromonas australica]|nr:DnaA regulatory inactivator Hda [Alteromonas australica]
MVTLLKDVATGMPQWRDDRRLVSLASLHLPLVTLQGGS